MATASRHHLLIAGTGRAGTTFLVRYLTQLGLDTRLSRSGETHNNWDEEAQAGLEDLPLSTSRAPDGLPYVIKSPWTYEVIDDLVADPNIQLDAAIFPMRDIVEAASSRTVLELRAMYQSAPWLAELSKNWETWWRTPGGIVYSISPIDQARILAMGFHQVINRLTIAEVPTIFLSFPKFIEDPDYLYRRLKPVLPPAVSLEAAIAAHGAVADKKKVRIGGELKGEDGAMMSSLEGPAMAELDRVALKREVLRLNSICGDLTSQLATAKLSSSEQPQSRRGLRRVALSIRDTVRALRMKFRSRVHR